MKRRPLHPKPPFVVHHKMVWNDDDIVDINLEVPCLELPQNYCK